MKKIYENHKNTMLLLVGIIILIISELFAELFLPLKFITSKPFLNYSFKIIKGVLSSTGIAVIVGFITLKIKTSHDLSAALSGKEKLRYLYSLISSNNGNALDLYKKQIVKEAFEYNSKYRDNVVYNVNVFMNNGKVYAKTKMSYIEYHSSKDWSCNELKTAFDDPDSSVKYYKIINPDNVNDFVKITDQIKKRNTKAHGDSLIYEHYCNIPKKYKKMSSLHIEKELLLEGNDHWINYIVMFACPLTKLNFKLNAESGLEVKEVTVIGNENLYSKQQDANSVNLSSTKWLSHYNGFSIVIGKV